MPQKFRCKESGCNNIVHYVPKITPVFKVYDRSRSTKSRTNRNKQTKTVYLECSDGHVHPYKVEVN